jgi:hypothetical protein
MTLPPNIALERTAFDVPPRRDFAPGRWSAQLRLGGGSVFGG